MVDATTMCSGTSTATTSDFLKILFGGIPDNLLVNLWTLPDKISYWLTSDNREIPPGLDGKDVYFSMSLAAQNLGPHQRLKAEQAAGITCLWADVDFGPEHKKKVPPDEATASKLLREYNLHPSLVVHSGHGYHAYWLLDEPWLFVDDTDGRNADRLAAAGAVEGLQTKLREHFGKSGYTLDATHDLARVLRLPGTSNHKDQENPLPVKVIWPDNLDQACRYDKTVFFAAFSPHIAAQKNETGQTFAGQQVAESKRTVDALAKEVMSKIILKADAEPAANIFSALTANCDKFVDTWKGARPDLADHSASSYDMAIANIAAAAGIDDQNIANLIIKHRREMGHEMEKALRPRYIALTIAKAKISASLDGIGNIPPAILPDVIESGESLTPEKRADYIFVMSERMGLPIKKFIKQGKENAQYSVVLQSGEEIYLGGAATILNQTQFRIKAYDLARKTMNPIASRPWLQVCDFIQKLAEVIDDEDSKDVEMAREWLDRYVEDNRSDPHDWKDQFMRCAPFVKDGQLHVAAIEFLKFIRFGIGYRKFELNDVRRVLRMLHFKSVKMSARKDQAVFRRGYWVGIKEECS